MYVGTHTHIQSSKAPRNQRITRTPDAIMSSCKINVNCMLMYGVAKSAVTFSCVMFV